MTKYILLLFILYSTISYACDNRVVIIDGKSMICTTCCHNNNCYTTCS